MRFTAWLVVSTLICLGTWSPAVGSPPNAYLVVFEWGSAGITSDRHNYTADNFATLNEVAKETKRRLSETDAIVVYIEGYADTSGPEAFNMQLSRRRAEAVADALVTLGVERRYLDITWYGESRLAVDTDDGIREQANRTVHIYFAGE